MDSSASHITVSFCIESERGAMELEVCRTMFDHDARSWFQLLLYFLCSALGQQSKIAWNSVVDEVVWQVLLCISQSAFALEAKDERSS